MENSPDADKLALRLLKRAAMLQHAAIGQKAMIPGGVSPGIRCIRDNRVPGRIVAADADDSEAGADPALWRPGPRGDPE